MMDPAINRVSRKAVEVPAQDRVGLLGVEHRHDLGELWPTRLLRGPRLAHWLSHHEKIAGLCECKQFPLLSWYRELLLAIVQSGLSDVDYEFELIHIEVGYLVKEDHIERGDEVFRHHSQLSWRQIPRVHGVIAECLAQTDKKGRARLVIPKARRPQSRSNVVR
jgi:hypothetical protein